MGRKMSRGKQQVLFNYLPGRTFDFERVATIAKVESIRGVQRTDLNTAVLLRKVAEEARAWHSDFRPILRDEVLRDPNRFVLLDPQQVQAEMFPKVFWCQNRKCGRIFDYSHSDSLPPAICPDCSKGQLIQLRFVKIHRCGALHPLRPPICQRCHTSNYMALDSRGSERISNFRWICRKCNYTSPLYGGACTECSWPNENQKRRMDIEVHRSGRTFYPHIAVLLNIPHRNLDNFLALPEWPALVAAKFLGIPEVTGKNLLDFARRGFDNQQGEDVGLSGTDLDALFRKQQEENWTAEQLARAIQNLRHDRERERRSSSPVAIKEVLEDYTGVSNQTWEHAGQEMLEAVMLLENNQSRELFSETPPSPACQIAREMGLNRLVLVTDFPIITATYGYSRAEYAPNECRLNPFPPMREHGGKFPIFVDQVQADALLISLDPERVCAWLDCNGVAPRIPSGRDETLSRNAYFVQLFEDVPLRETLHDDNPQARMVLGLLHTMSHLSLRQAALLCGLERTSLSEYLIPRALMCVIYCNHRFGATIGALTALFEQSLPEWLRAIKDTRRCVYDPVCRDRENSCHACTHLPETSCRLFNLNLSRAFLFGGPDPELGDIAVGYLDMSFGG